MILNVYKPTGISTYDVIRGIKRGIRPLQVKIGHAGTLDPFAEGVVLVLVGDSTKRSSELMALRKTYRGTIELGAATASADPDTQCQETSPLPAGLSIEDAQGYADTFIGRIMQTPPVYSALRIGGRRSYELARKGTPIVPEPREVDVYSLMIVAYEPPLMEFVADVGKGTYLRSLAVDLARAMGTVGHLRRLRRERIGPYASDAAVTI